MNHRLRLALAVALFLGVILASGCGLPSASGPTETAAPVTVQIARGDVARTVTANGTLTADSVNLSFEIGGRIATLLVAEGDSVSAGDAIAMLDQQSLEDAIHSADLGLQTARVQLQQASEPASAADLASAQAGLSQAQVALNTLYKDPTDTDRQEAQFRVDQARNSLWAQQAARDATAGNPYSTGASKDGAEAGVLNAEVAVEQALLAQGRLDDPPSQSAIAGARAQVAAAQASVDRLTELPNALTVSAAEIGVQQAEFALKQAQARLGDATLRAPMDGVLLSVSVKAGEYVAPNQPIAVLAQPAPLYVSAMIDEIDVVDLMQGQTATATFDALGDRQHAAELTFLAPQGRASSGIPAYEAHITLAENDSPLRLGMSANVEVTIAEARNAILVPNQALIGDRDTDAYSVTVVTALGSRTQAVTLGIQGEDYAEVLDGLSEGDTVELVMVAVADNTALPGFSGPMGGGMGGFR